MALKKFPPLGVRLGVGVNLQRTSIWLYQQVDANGSKNKTVTMWTGRITFGLVGWQVLTDFLDRQGSIAKLSELLLLQQLPHHNLVHAPMLANS